MILRVTVRYDVERTGDLAEGVFQHVGIQPGEKLEIELLPGGEFKGRAVRKRGSIRDLAGCLKGKPNGAALTIEEINEAIAEAGAEAGMADLKR